MQRLELNLKTILKSKNVKILKIKELQTKKLTDFLKKYPGRIINGYANSLKYTSIPINSTLSQSSLKKQIDDLKLNNDKINNENTFFKGIEIPLNNVPLCKNSEEHKVFFCAAAIGNPLFSQHKQLRSLPTGFNSFITPFNNSLEKENKLTENFSTENIIEHISNSNQFSYILDTSRVLPLYEIIFEYDPNLNTHDGKCDNCHEIDCIMFCYAERAHLCESCDKLMHNNDLLRRHKREYFKNSDGTDLERIIYFNCLIHTNTTVEYFCKDCLIPLCVQCRVTGFHALTNINIKEHRMITYLEATEKYEINFNSLNEREINLKNLINEINSELKKFELNINEIKLKIESEYKSALNELKTFTNKNYRILNSGYLQCLSIKDYINNLKLLVNKFNSGEIIENFQNLINELSSIKVDVEIKEKYVPVDLDGNLRIYKINNKNQRYEKELMRNLDFKNISESSCVSELKNN